MNATLNSMRLREPSVRRPDHSPATFAKFGTGYLPGLLGIEMLVVDPERMV